MAVLKLKNLADFYNLTQSLKCMEIIGRVSRVVGTVIEGQIPECEVGQMCHIYGRAEDAPILAEVVGFQDSTVILMPLGDMRGLRPGSEIHVLNSAPTVKVGEHLLGRVLNSLGDPMDDKGPLMCQEERPLYADPINPYQRRRIHETLDVGIRSINALSTICVGQRMAIMAGSGVGKSVLLGMMARNTEADINVIGLVGERGRELQDFLQRDLGPEGIRRSVVVAATSDTSPLIRVRAAFVATAIAEYFRDQGKKVLLMMDSVTRFAMAQREVGLAAGEPPTSKGYTPSVFSLLPRLLERAGMGSQHSEGSITGLYTVLVEGDDMNEPIADAVRSILDGHLVLSRDLADQGHYPAIDVLGSVSRLMADVVSDAHMQAARRVLALLAAHRRAETLINIGAYVRGSNREVDTAIAMMDDLNGFLRQDMTEQSPMDQTLEQMQELATRKVDTRKGLTPARANGVMQPPR